MNFHDAVKAYIPRNPDAHKGVFGKALLCVGSQGMMGAAVLSSRACLRSGVGLCYIMGPVEGLEIAQISVPEAIYRSGVESTAGYDAVGCGCGLGKSDNAVAKVDFFLSGTTCPLLLDADALNIISEQGWQNRIPAGTIITPHSVEFERISGLKAQSRDEQTAQASDFAVKYGCIVVLKGAGTAIVDVDGTVDINTTGNSGMATAGSGDVLTGIITGLLAQGYKPYTAAKFGVFLHGLAGDLASAVKTEESLIASDIIEYIPAAYKRVIYG